MVEHKESITLSLPVFARIRDRAEQQGVFAYVVGGYVRDALLGKEVHDLDVVVIGDGIQFARQLAEDLGVRTIVAYERFGTAMIPMEAGKLEIVSARKEKYSHDSRKPVVAAGTLEEDLLRRDFRVNAITASLNARTFGVIVDPLGGQEDLHLGILRTPLDPTETYDDDPLRMMRAVRFASQLGFTIERKALEAIPVMKDRLSIVSQERLTDEFLRILMTAKPSVGLKLMFQTGLLPIVFPEIAQMAGVDQRNDRHHKDVFLHTCAVVDNIAQTTDDVWLRFVALVHDIAKPRTKAYQEGVGWTFHGHEEVGARMMRKVFQRLRLPQVHLPYVEKLVRLHLRPMVLVDDIVTDSAVRRVMFEAGPDIDDLMKLCRADITSKNPNLVRRYLRNYDVVMQKIQEVEEKDRIRNWQPPVKGEEIMAVCGIQPGKKVGELKTAIEEAILDGLIANDHDAALEYLLSIKDAILAK